MMHSLVMRRGVCISRALSLSRAFSTSPPISLKSPSLFKQQCYVGGSWIDSKSGQTHKVYNPATGVFLGTVPHMGGTDTTEAIAAATKAQPSWTSLTFKQRANILRTWYDSMMKHDQDLAAILTAEQGKPLTEALGEIHYAAGFLELYAEEATRIYGEMIPPPAHNTRILVQRQPLGLVGAITPWNFPAAMITRKVGAALAAGCPVVLKPSELTPFSALALAHLGHEAGIPAGIFNVITGDAGSIGTAMTSDERVKKIAFTGSTRVGKLLMQQAAGQVKRTSMELGGNAPFIVFDDADLEKAVTGAMACKFRNAGQTCVTANRIFVQSGIFDAFASQLAKRASGIKLGNGAEPGVQQGPLISQAAVQKVDSHVRDALARGGSLLTGGTPASNIGPFFYHPTVITGGAKEWKGFQEETFGPVAILYKFDVEEEAIRLANDTTAGLASYFYTSSISRMFRVSEALQYGMVAVNQPSVSQPVAPFGGMKESGTGREGSHHGLNDYLEIKAVHIGI